MSRDNLDLCERCEKNKIYGTNATDRIICQKCYLVLCSGCSLSKSEKELDLAVTNNYCVAHEVQE